MHPQQIGLSSGLCNWEVANLPSGVHLEYLSAFELDEVVKPLTSFSFKPGHIQETWLSSHEAHLEVLKNYVVHCQDFFLVRGTPQDPQQVLLVERAEEPLKNSWWPLGGRSFNCPNEASELAPLWRRFPFYASLLLVIYRECGLQPDDIAGIGKLTRFQVSFQDQADSELFNRHHTADVFAVFLNPEAEKKVRLMEAKIGTYAWCGLSELQDLARRRELVGHVRKACSAIFDNKFRVFLDCADYSI